MFQDDYPKEILRGDIAAAVMQPRVDIVRFLVKRSPETARTADKVGDSLHHDAALVGAHEVIDVLVFGLGLDVNQSNNSGETPIHIADSQGKVKVMERLMARGADMDKVDQSGDTPLYVAAAACRHKPEAYNFLLGQGASVDPRNGSNQTPLYLACQSENDDAVRSLLYHGADPNIWADRMTGDRVGLRVMVNHEGDNVIDSTWEGLGDAPIHIAAIEGECVQMLLDKGLYR
ncbi:hypothetical protein DL769_003175 [Monosporascus sp. CRB-8-3]|nr:hypothetical protein DL769_003175 [Monosporascus sp. CRB-8-3]